MVESALNQQIISTTLCCAGLAPHLPLLWPASVLGGGRLGVWCCDLDGRCTRMREEESRRAGSPACSAVSADAEQLYRCKLSETG